MLDVRDDADDRDPAPTRRIAAVLEALADRILASGTSLSLSSPKAAARASAPVAPRPSASQ